MHSPRFLILETSHRLGWVALAQGNRVSAMRRLDEARRHARDLVPAVALLLADQAWKPRDLDAVIVSKGPGSYTGLRVGIMSATTLAYATGCALVGIDTFAAIAWQTPADAEVVDVVADAQQDKVYVQRFAASASGFSPAGLLAVQTWEAWQAALPQGTWVTGPGLEGRENRLSSHIHWVARADRLPHPASFLELGRRRFLQGDKDNPLTLEPTYLRPSAAEEKCLAR